MTIEDDVGDVNAHSPTIGAAAAGGDAADDEAAFAAQASKSDEYRIVHEMPIFSTLTGPEKRRVVDMLTHEHFAPNVSLIRVGAPGTRLFLNVKVSEFDSFVFLFSFTRTYD